MQGYPRKVAAKLMSSKAICVHGTPRVGVDVGEVISAGARPKTDAPSCDCRHRHRTAHRLAPMTSRAAAFWTGASPGKSIWRGRDTQEVEGHTGSRRRRRRVAKRRESRRRRRGVGGGRK